MLTLEEVVHGEHAGDDVVRAPVAPLTLTKLRTHLEVTVQRLARKVCRQQANAQGSAGTYEPLNLLAHKQLATCNIG